LKRIFVSVTNDLLTDQRVFRTIDFLFEHNFIVTAIGRKLQKKYPPPSNIKIKRFRLLFNKGPLFYLCYNVRLFFYLLFKKKDYLLANDLDTLLANYMVSKFSKAVLIYDSHELFTEVPELIHRLRTKKIWEHIESIALPKVKKTYTVCQPIADYYNKKYGTDFKVVRNLPYYRKDLHSNDLLVSLAQKRKIVLYQGALNIGRGLEQLIEAVKLIFDRVVLIIIGNGDIMDRLVWQAKEQMLDNTVFFLDRIPFDKLADYTSQADIGVSLEQPGFGLSYEYSLPNKIFDYIQAEIPILGSNLPGIKSIINTYKVGCTISDFSPKNLSKTIINMISDTEKRLQWKDNLKIAKKELCWENEKKILKTIFLS